MKELGIPLVVIRGMKTSHLPFAEIRGKREKTLLHLNRRWN